MKKIFFLISISIFLAGNCYAAATDLSTVLKDTALSNNVTGWYSIDSTTNPQAYILQTGHSSGNRIFGSGSFATTVSYSNVTDPTAQIISDSTAFDSTEFDSGATWTAVGE